MDKAIVGGLSIFVPRGYGTPHGPRPSGHCNLCGQDLYGSVDVNTRHLVACAHGEAGDRVLREREAYKQRMAIFEDPSLWSPEAEEHVKKVGERMKREGRLTMRPNERVHNE